MRIKRKPDFNIGGGVGVLGAKYKSRRSGQTRHCQRPTRGPRAKKLMHLHEGFQPKKGNWGSGTWPEIMSANARPEPTPMVHPKVPCPVLRYRLGMRVRPMRGTLEGVEGRKPDQNETLAKSRAVGNKPRAS